MHQINIDPRHMVYVARQPILDSAGKVFGYELLYRAGAQETACTTSAQLASARVLTDTILNLGLDTITNGRLAFFNLTRLLLVNDAGTLLPAANTVLELHEDIQVDDEVIDACRRLHKLGYKLALDDFTVGSDAEALLPYVKFVKVDVLDTPTDMWGPVAARLAGLGVTLVAEKVESADVVSAAKAAGYSLFQGFYFCKPSTFTAAAIPSRRLAYLSLMAALSRPDLSFADLENLIKHDVSLCFRVLRCVNSAAFGLRHQVTSIRQALVLLGMDQIRRWAMVWSLSGVNDGGAAETCTLALLRARCCELIGEALGVPEGGSEYFLLGLCSLLDAILGRPMSAALEEIPLPDTIRNALLGQSNVARTVLDMVIAYERGEWADAVESMQEVKLAVTRLPTAYADALRWARELSRNAVAA